jgi:hypothetical protein
MSTSNLPGGKGRPVRKADLTAICEPTMLKMWETRRLGTLEASEACHRSNFDLIISRIRVILRHPEA